jgi:hypothetical protein
MPLDAEYRTQLRTRRMKPGCECVRWGDQRTRFRIEPEATRRVPVTDAPYKIPEFASSADLPDRECVNFTVRATYGYLWQLSIRDYRIERKLVPSALPGREGAGSLIRENFDDRHLHQQLALHYPKCLQI